MNLVAGYVAQVALLVMNGQHQAWQHLDLADAHHVKGGVGHPRNHTQRLDFLCGVARQDPVGWRHIVNGNHRQFVLVTAFFELSHDPVAVSGRYDAVFVFASVPALEQRLCCHRISQFVDFGQNFKTPVENQLRIGIGALDVLDKTGHTCNLFLLGFGCFGHQVKRVQCVQKKCTVTLIPQRLDDLRQVKRRPARRSLVNHDGAPGGVFTQFPFGPHGFEIAPRGVDFAHRNIGGDGGAWVQAMAPAPNTSVGAQAIGHVARFNHRHIKRTQCLPRNVFAVIKSK